MCWDSLLLWSSKKAKNLLQHVMLAVRVVLVILCQAGTSIPHRTKCYSENTKKNSTLFVHARYGLVTMVRRQRKA